MPTNRARNPLVRVAFAFAMLALFGVSLMLDAGTVAGAKSQRDENCGDKCQEQLTEARIATARYHRESRAFRDGFISTQECVAVPQAGGMGVHYINLQRMMDTTVDASAPEILLYEPDKNGRMRLVGVEYYVPVLVMGANGPEPYFGTEPPANPLNQPPVLFGQKFDGPMPGHGPGEPWHYDLHVWLWKHNPAGMFAPFNPKVSCQPQDGDAHTGDAH